MYIYVCVCVCKYICINICTYTCIYVCVHTNTHTCIVGLLSPRPFVYTESFSIHKYICIHIYMYICVWTHTFIPMCVYLYMHCCHARGRSFVYARPSWRHKCFFGENGRFFGKKITPHFRKIARDSGQLVVKNIYVSTALFVENDAAFLGKYRALLRRCRALLRKYRALLRKYWDSFGWALI